MLSASSVAALLLGSPVCNGDVGAGAGLAATPAGPIGLSEVEVFGCHFFRSGADTIGALGGSSAETVSGGKATGTTSCTFGSALLGCHFLRSGAGGAMGVEALGEGVIGPETVEGASAGTTSSLLLDTAALGCHFFRSAGAVGGAVATGGANAV